MQDARCNVAISQSNKITKKLDSITTRFLYFVVYPAYKIDITSRNREERIGEERKFLSKKQKPKEKGEIQRPYFTSISNTKNTIEIS